MTVTLPEPLKYLRPFVRSLAKRPAATLNEDVDPSPLEAALRRRVQGMTETAAADALAGDQALLKQWLSTSAPPGHPAYWVLGFLSSPGVVRHILRPDSAAPVGPDIVFAAPAGWKVKGIPRRLDLRKGKVVGMIAVIDELSFGLMQQQLSWLGPPGEQVQRESQAVQAGEVSGHKYVRRQAGPAGYKRVDYVLRVPGGFACATLSSSADFDERPFDLQLGTLRLVASE